MQMMKDLRLCHSVISSDINNKDLLSGLMEAYELDIEVFIIARFLAFYTL